jgi:hypothetical protein
VPSVAYRGNGRVVNQPAPTFPLDLRQLPDFRLIERYLSDHYDKAYDLWYADHYDLKRMITLPLDGLPLGLPSAPAVQTLLRPRSHAQVHQHRDGGRRSGAGRR